MKDESEAEVLTFSSFLLHPSEQGFQRQAVCQPHEFLDHRCELFRQGPGFFELALGRTIFKLGRHATGHRGKRRHHPAKLVSGLAQTYRVPLSQGILNCRQMIRQASPERLTDPLQNEGVAPARRQ
jgi:hypothetical protein